MPSPSGLPASLQIRPVTPADAPAVATLTGELGYARAPEAVARWIDQLTALHELDAQHPGLVPLQAVLVACDGETVLGWIQVEIQRHLQEEQRALIAGLVVSAEARSRGVGRALCQAAEDWARRRSIGALRVTSRSTRERAHQFYLRDGYLRVKTSEVFEKPLGNS